MNKPTAVGSVVVLPLGAFVAGRYSGDRVIVRELGKTLTDNPPLFDPASRTLKLRLVVSPGGTRETKQIHSSSHRETYQGETYVFCSDRCQKKFQQDPAKYIGEKMESTASLQPKIEAVP
jgi:YHS domain-containing protein